MDGEVLVGNQEKCHEAGDIIFRENVQIILIIDLEIVI